MTEIIASRILGSADGFDLRVHIEPDAETTPENKGDNVYDKADQQKWIEGDWQFVTVVVTVSRGGFDLASASQSETEHGHMGDGRFIDALGEGGSFVGTYAANLIDEALTEAKATFARIVEASPDDTIQQVHARIEAAAELLGRDRWQSYVAEMGLDRDWEQLGDDHRAAWISKARDTATSLDLAGLLKLPTDRIVSVATETPTAGEHTARTQIEAAVYIANGVVYPQGGHSYRYAVGNLRIGLTFRDDGTIVPFTGWYRVDKDGKVGERKAFPSNPKTALVGVLAEIRAHGV